MNLNPDSLVPAFVSCALTLALIVAVAIVLLREMADAMDEAISAADEGSR